MCTPTASRPLGHSSGIVMQSAWSSQPYPLGPTFVMSWLTGVRGDHDIGIICMMHLLFVIVFAAFICCILFGYLCLTCIQDFHISRTTCLYTQVLVSTVFSCLFQMHSYLSYQETVRMISARCCFFTLHINCTC